MKRPNRDDIIYTAGRLAQERASTTWSIFPLGIKLVSYAYVAGSLIAVDFHWIANPLRFTVSAVLLGLATLFWQVIVFTKANKQRQRDSDALKEAGFSLTGIGASDAILTGLLDISETTIIRGELPVKPVSSPKSTVRKRIAQRTAQATPYNPRRTKRNGVSHR